MMNINYIKQQVDTLYPQLTSVRHFLHQNPELSQQEFQTQAYIAGILEEAGIEFSNCADTGIVAVVNGDKKGKVVGIRADIDALPIQECADEQFQSCVAGVMHACGHDIHTTIALGTALFFQKNKADLEGSVKFFFQPAEETVGGAKRMVQEGCLANPSVDYCIGLHVSPKIETGNILLRYGTCNASTDSFEIIIHGKEAHGARPEEGIDAIIIGSEIVSALQTVVSRSLSPLDPSVLTIGYFQAGTAGNIIANEAHLRGTFRASNSQMRQEGLEQIKRICHSISEAFGGRCEIQFDPYAYNSLENDAEVVDVIAHEATQYLGADHVLWQDQMSMGGEDFSFFIEDIPGAFYQLGCQKHGSEEFGLHTAGFAANEECIKTGCGVHIVTTLNLLQK